ncbi:hypothetical protein QQ020_03195 [Fulvivirgaceae bacterium BMA12]|uniref:Uncharacterized protein n=1 Tax=Agaribacillus aureus TaxID=3051825 RepID=A0ABT8KZW6_9BACT|nr:hypothetical protein [Fulvivirgaceae bacterium BMA12]
MKKFEKLNATKFQTIERSRMEAAKGGARGGLDTATYKKSYTGSVCEWDTDDSLDLVMVGSSI